MTSTTTRIITIAFAALALATPAATAKPTREENVPRAQSLEEWTRSVRNFDGRAAVFPARRPPTMTPVVRTERMSVHASNGMSPLVYILPSVALLAIVAAVAYALSARAPARYSRIAE